MTKSLAIYYESDGYSTSGKRLLGRQAAGAGFLKGLVEHSSFTDLYCYTSSPAGFTHFQETVKPWNHRQLQFQELRKQAPAHLARAGTLYLPGPGLSQAAWSRRFTDQRAYSLCGVTHTIASSNAMSDIGDLLVAPVQPWDALICTSQAVKTAVDRLLDTWADYLADRLGSRPAMDFQLPVIPLGIDCNFFAHNLSARQKMRQTLKIPFTDIVVLFIGRLCFYAKAHPIPMYIALEQAAQETNAKIHLVQAGWFENTQEEAEFLKGPQQFCPSVNSIFLDGRSPLVRSDVWSAADIFVSLVDNIQETFGLTPIEAMAAGLPVIVTDWDGYKESVRDGIDGFKIPTAMPPPPAGQQLAAEYYTETLNYSGHIAHTAALAMVDIPATKAALVKLIQQPELRAQMGANGRQRAREVYDWSVVIGAYDRLWTKLAEIRNIAAMSAPVKGNHPPHPLCADPFQLFQHYPSQTLTLQSLVTLGSMASPAQIALVRQNWMSNYGANRRPDFSLLDRLIESVRQQSPVSIENLLPLVPELSGIEVIGAIANLLKFDILGLAAADRASS